MPKLEVHDYRDIEELRARVFDAAQLAREKLNTLSADPLEALRKLKFEEWGYHPVPGPKDDRRLNFIEQLNQTFTTLVSLAAAQCLMEWFPQSGGLRLNLGATPGRDIKGIIPNELEAEVFAAVSPKNNGKITKDIKRLDMSPARHRYVFFYAPEFSSGRQGSLEQPGSEVRVHALGLDKSCRYIQRSDLDPACSNLKNGPLQKVLKDNRTASTIRFGLAPTAHAPGLRR